MSEKIKTGVAAGGLILSIGLAAAGCYQAWAILPYRVDQTEREVNTMKDERKIDREILIRIEEQVKALREELRGRRVITPQGGVVTDAELAEILAGPHFLN